MATDDVPEPIILEYEPLTELQERLPHHTGILPVEVFYTCVHASPKFLALGSGNGLVVIANLSNWKLKIFHSDSHTSVTVVRLNSCIRAVAYGCSDGTTSIDLFSPVHDLDTQVTKYLVREAQNITVSALEWDQGGETLYIGYNNGKIVQVSFQFEKGTCSSTTLLQTGWSVCQLSYLHGNLLISTMECSLMYSVSTGKVKQVGQGQRKSGPYGGCFGLHEIDPHKAFVARPGFRIWSTNETSEVLSTCKLKEAVFSKDVPSILLLSFDAEYTPPEEMAHFSLLYPWHGQYLVTNHMNYLWVLDPSNARIVGACCHSNNIIGVAPCRDDIFVLLGKGASRTVLKLSMRADLQKFMHKVVTPVIESKPPLGQMDSPLVQHVALGVRPREPTDSVVTPAAPLPRQDSVSLDQVKMTAMKPAERKELLRKVEDFQSDDDFGALVKKVKKKGKKKAVSSKPHKKPSTPELPPPKEFPTVTSKTDSKVSLPVVKQENSAINQTKSPEHTKEEVPMASEDGSTSRATAESAVKDQPLKESAQTPNPAETHKEPLLTSGMDGAKGNKEAGGAQITEEVDYGPQQSEEDPPPLAEHDREIHSSDDPKQIIPKEQADNSEGEDVGEGDGERECSNDEDMIKGDSVDEISNSDDSWVPLNNSAGGATLDHLASVVASDRRLWALDSKGGIWHRHANAVQSGDSNEWVAEKGVTLHQISISETGKLLWGISNKTIVAKSLIPTKGMMLMQSWKPVGRDDRDVRAISVAIGSTCGWALEEGGRLLCRDNVTDTNPVGTLWHVVKEESDYRKLSCHGHMLWCVTEAKSLVVKVPSVKDHYTSEWIHLPTPCRVNQLCLTPETAWIIGEDNRVFFRCGLSAMTPCGRSPWWEISVQSAHTEHSHTSIRRMFSLKSWFSHTEQLSSIAASSQLGVWILGSSGQIYGCMSSLMGSYYQGISSSEYFRILTWKDIAAGGISHAGGNAWLLRDDGELYTCSLSGEIVKAEIEKEIRCIDAHDKAMWVLKNTGDIDSREGFDDAHPIGFSWEPIDVQQLQPHKATHIGIGSTSAWLVDEAGEPWFRFDVISRDRESGFSQVWVQSGLDGAENQLSKIKVGSLYVWALDVKGNVYTRLGVSAEFPIGKKWLMVEGAKGKDLCVSMYHVWILTPEGSVLCRHGISPVVLEGLLWKKVPGSFEKISCTKEGQLWGLQKDNSTVVKRLTRTLKFKYATNKHEIDTDSFTEAVALNKEDWEVL